MAQAIESLPIQKDEYHREYATDTGSAYYSSAVSFDSESGTMRPTGRHAILASGEIYGVDGEVVEQTTVHIGYEGGEATYVAVNRQDMDLLGGFYTRGRGEKGVLLAPISDISQFSGPFSQDKTIPVESSSDLSEFVFREENSLIIERIDPSTNLATKIKAPFFLDEELSNQLVLEGKSDQAEDSDQAFLQPDNKTELSDEQIVFQVPTKYPVLFSAASNIR